MLAQEAISTANLIKNDQITRYTLIFVLFVTSLFVIFFSSISAFIVFASYILGFVVCGFLLKYQNSASSCLQRLASIYRGHFSPHKPNKEKICSICTGVGCSRHFSNNRTPWKSLRINKKLNNAVEKFLQHILDDFILSWYQNYTNDKSFVNELKYSIRFGASSAVNRFLEVDMGKIITSKLVPCAIKHVDDYLCMVQIAELKNVDVNKIAVDYLGKRLHVAASSRKNELKYLRFLAASLIERVLPTDNLKCRNYSILLREIMSGWVFLPLMDVLADPNIINSLVILTTTYKSKGSVAQNEPTVLVEFLENFSKIEHNTSSLASDLKTILKNQQLLYAFMQFMKREGTVSLLNFCLDVEAFNEKLLRPDLSKRQLEELHTEAINLHKTYLVEKSLDFIGCSHEIANSLEKLLNEGVYNVAKLQTSEPLFQAYDFAFNILENDWMPQFHHSNEFYNFICGSKVTPHYYKGTATSPFITQGSPIRIRHKKYYESSNQGAVAKISSGFGRIKGALQTKQPVEGSVYPHESKILESDPTFVEDLLPTERNLVHRDMSAWRISIPAVETHQFGSKPIFIFNINVQRVDTISENEIRHWTVHRRDQDFYTLKSKLIEFHGESEICSSPLPSRRTNMTLDLRKAKYEEFLKKLLEKPSLKGSDLLHTFLTSAQNFTLLVSTPMPIVDLENIYQSVAYKLRKEKGQHLDIFMNTFLNSTGRQKPNKFEWAEVGDEVDIFINAEADTQPKTMHNNVFGNNYGVNYKKEIESSSSSINPSGITESAFYLLKHIFKVPSSILKLYIAICSVSQQAVESFSRMYIERKIKAALSQPTLAFLINQLEDVIFEKHHTPSTLEQLEERKKLAFKELEKVIPNFLVTILGEDFKNGALNLLKILQNPLYNKQLAYNLIDIVVAEMYPELDGSEEFY